MSSMLHKLNNIRSLRALSREFSIDVLEEMLEKLRIVTEEKRTQQQQAAQQQAEYQEKVNTWLELMRADGISPDELVADIQPPKAGGKSVNRARRNIIIPIILAQRKPTGQGRMPKPIAEAVARGKSLDSFLI